METTPTTDDELLFGWDTTPGIVSVWADRSGRAVIWRRVGAMLHCETQRYRPWLFAASLSDVAHLGRALQAEDELHAQRALCCYRELDGPSDSLRFLLSSNDGRVLEQAILTGANRRRATPATSLYDLEPDYYRVGPVEQYLIASGRVYFRGLAFHDLHRMQIDLETTSLDPTQGRIFMVALRSSNGFATTIDAPTPADEAALIAEVCRLVREHDPDIIENHNLFGFDLPFLTARADALGVPLLLGRSGGPARLERYDDPTRSRSSRRQVRYSIAGRELLDTLDAVRRHDFVARDLPSHRLKDVARSFGIATSDRTYLRGAAIFSTYQHDPELVQRYALDDVAEVAGLSERLHTAPFALAGMAPRRFERVASAGPAMGILEPMLVRAYYRASAALPLTLTQADLPPHSGGALHLFATGVARHVVKADVASLYPSLMRTFQIGPASDRIGVLLRIVSRLTDLRFMHKAAARTTPVGSLEAGHHHAMQAAMKLIINSAYGYMGAGSMALFADRNAADEVTRRGRDLLSQIVAALHERGVTLIEADTDGVFFATPEDWDEPRERQLVAEVAALLPSGVRLEYEGRYAAMFSHEVKNYALLTYNGDLIMKGVALRSSRSEPFGERFLQQALHAVLRGDIVAAQQHFIDTVMALRSRALPISDVAARMRLSKSPETYLANRRRLREAPYEALLNAGRQQWRAGQKIRCYRTTNGYAWLPDDDDENQDAGDEHDDEQATAIYQGVERSTPAPSSNATLPAYDSNYYVQQLLNSYAERLRKAFRPADFEQLFRLDTQLGLFDRPVAEIRSILDMSAEKPPAVAL